MKKLLFFFCFIIVVPNSVGAQTADTLKGAAIDTIPKPVIVPVVINQYQLAVQSLIDQNKYLNSKSTPVALIIQPKKAATTDVVFYILAALLLLMALIKFFYPRYFTNLFRVFFNSSLRQSQLTDQLLQDKLPSLFFNLFYILSGGVYIFFLLAHFKLISHNYNWMLLAGCIMVLGLVYLVKFSTLKFTGWITGYVEETDTYIFIIFLINKIIGICVMPFVIIMVLAAPALADSSAYISLLIVVFLLLLRFFRAYGLLQNKLKISKLHFFLYIAGAEIIPLLLLYKWLLIFLSKNS